MVEDDSFDKEGILDNLEEFPLLINLGVYGLIKSAKPSHDFSPSFKEVSLKNPLRVLSNKISNNSSSSPIASIQHQNVTILISNKKGKKYGLVPMDS